MSEAEPVRAALIAHGGMAAGLIDAVRNITGCSADAIVPVSNIGMSPESLAEAVRAAVGDGPAIIFTDLQSGSCGLAARRVARSCTDVVVVSAVNLPLLIDFVMNRSVPLDELVPRLLDRGRSAIACAPATLPGT
jgi:mannose/fructose-specific phosphotransferase system component IIA